MVTAGGGRVGRLRPQEEGAGGTAAVVVVEVVVVGLEEIVIVQFDALSCCGYVLLCLSEVGCQS